MPISVISLVAVLIDKKIEYKAFEFCYSVQNYPSEFCYTVHFTI